MKKTILYIGGFRLPDRNAAAHRVIANAKLLKSLGYNVVFIDVDDDCQTNIIKTKRNIYGFTCYSVLYPSNYSEWYKYITNINNVITISNLYNDIVAIIAYNYPAVGLKRLIKFCNKHSYKLIGDVTEWYTKSKNPIKNIDTNLRMKKIHKNLDGIIAISRYLYNYYEKNTEVVYLPPLIDAMDEKWQQPRNAHDSLRFAYTGSGAKHKDKLNLIIEVLYELNKKYKYKFRIMGIDRQTYLTYYPEHKKILNEMEDRVVFMGRVMHIEALRCVINSDFSLFFRPDTLTVKAGFPTKFVEAISCGTPVITNRISDLGEYVKDGENAILIDGFEKDDINKAFVRIFNMKKNDIDIIRCNCKDIKYMFDYRIYKDDFKDFMKRIMEK